MHLSHNTLKGLPLDFYVLTALTELRLDDNRVTSLSSDLGRLTRLRVLWLHQNLLEVLPREAGRLSELETLTLTGNQLRCLPYELGALARLRDLPLQDNPDLASPPPELVLGGGGSPVGGGGGRAAADRVRAYLNRFAASLTSPHQLDLASLGLRDVPQDVAGLTATTALELGCNLLSALPVAIFWDVRFGLPRHPRLTKLGLAGNSLAELPPAVARLARLRALDVSENPLLRALPLELTRLTCLTALAAAGSPLELPPAEVVAHGVDSCALEGCQHHPAANAVYRITAETHNGRPVFAVGGGGGGGGDHEGGAREVPRLFCGGRNGTAYWCVGQSPADEERCWLRVLDPAAARPGDVRAVWDEAGLDGAFRANPAVHARGLGVMPFLRRVCILAAERDGLAALRARCEQNEGVLQAARKVQAYLRLREENQAELSRRAAEVALDLGGLLLRSVPTTEWGRDVRRLVLDGSQLRAVPACVFLMSQLESASIRDGALRDADGPWRRLKRLRELFLDRNQLAELPAGLARLPALVRLGLSENRLESVPECIAGLSALTELALSRNSVRTLPDALGSALTSLDLSHNDMRDLGPAEWRPGTPLGGLGGLERLRTLLLEGNQLEELPAAAAGLTALTVLSISGNGLAGGRALRAALGGGRWRLLASLDASRNKIAGLPFSLGELALLADVCLTDNELDHLPLAVLSLPALTSLDLSGNLLPVVPPQVGRLTRLAVLRLARNQIAGVAPDLRRCVVLAALDLSRNRLRYLPPAAGMPLDVLGALRALTDLDLSGNCLAALPPDLPRAAALRRIATASNPFEAAPALRRALDAPRLGVLRVGVISAAGLGALRTPEVCAYCTVALEADPTCGPGGGLAAAAAARTATRFGTDCPEWGEVFPLFCGGLDGVAAVVTCFNAPPRAGPQQGILAAVAAEKAAVDAVAAADVADAAPLRVGAVSLPLAACVLRALPLFGFFPFPALAAAAGLCSTLSLGPGEALARRGDEGGGLHAVLAGALQETDGAGGVRDLAAGGVAGAMAAISGEPREWAVHASSHGSIHSDGGGDGGAVVLEVPPAALSALFHTAPDALAVLLLWLVPRSDAAGRVRAARPPGLVWGSQAWARRRGEEEAVLSDCARRVAERHALHPDQARQVCGCA